MVAKNADDRALIARIAANTRWGRTGDRAAATSAARNGLRAKFAREIDPDGTLATTSPAELDRRIDQLHRAHMQRMSLAAKQARQRLARAAGSDRS